MQSLSISDRVKRKLEWNTLKIRWGPDPLVSNDEVYIKQPRTVQQVLQEQYKHLPDALEKQCIGKTTIGYRYWKGNDTGAILIFDKQGTIAGIQIASFIVPVPTCIPKRHEELGGFTTQHLYFNTDPANLEC
ncbi:unnamed protein product [Rotaria sp. Silwood2]|nr:unnamed protein product [Rotaria sp. Silwood2]CAF4192547.1 unnamed protein product [Rotaria sp. Silwood2]CAF4214101.1 unnamed protein product [Rotaria sp. Silwood2]CAF4261931.1 unnamed protein product [Rotaria sp. Silwood2]